MAAEIRVGDGCHLEGVLLTVVTEFLAGGHSLFLHVRRAHDARARPLSVCAASSGYRRRVDARECPYHPLATPPALPKPSSTTR